MGAICVYTGNQQKLQSLLREVRLEAGFRQQDLADAFGEPQSFVSKIETGERRLDVLELRAVCRVLSVSLSDFMARLEEQLD